MFDLMIGLCWSSVNFRSCYVDLVVYVMQFDTGSIPSQADRHAYWHSATLAAVEAIDLTDEKQQLRKYLDKPGSVLPLIFNRSQERHYSRRV